jgi:hypothetical protein
MFIYNPDAIMANQASNLGPYKIMYGTIRLESAVRIKYIELSRALCALEYRLVIDVPNSFDKDVNGSSLLLWLPSP